MKMVVKRKQPKNDTQNVEGFVAKLFRIVNDVSTNDIIEWGDDNSYFVIHNKRRFTEQILTQ